MRIIIFKGNTLMKDAKISNTPNEKSLQFVRSPQAERAAAKKKI